MRIKFLPFSTVTFAIVACVLLVAMMSVQPTKGQDTAPTMPYGNDVAVESLNLTNLPLSPREPATLTAVIRNIGDTTLAGRRVYLYIDPPDQPPISTTVASKEFVAGVQWPPGDAMTVEYSGFTVNVAGCNHVAYAWVDPLDRIAETNEANNLQAIPFCVEYPTAPGPDPFENDDLCDQASPITPNQRAQVRSFSNATDVDWVEFQATKDVTYTVVADGTGASAFPNLELWDTCALPPPGAFGTTSRLEFVPPESGTYYLRLENDQPVADPSLTSYELSVQATGAGGGGGGGALPAVVSITPNQGDNDRNTNVVIDGVNLAAPTLVELCPATGTQCDTRACLPIIDASWAEQAQKIYGVVPANTFGQGQYCLAVTNQGGRTGYLHSAFTVLPGLPDLRQVTPAAAYSDAPTDISVFGFNFHPGLMLNLGGVNLTPVLVGSRTLARATVPADLPVGTYPLTAYYDPARPVMLADAFTVLAPQDDLFGQTQELWSDPTAPRAEAPARLGLVVHRQGGVAPLTNVVVRFTVNGAVLGDVATPLLPPDGAASTEWLTWTPAQPGDHTVVAWIDPNQTTPEASELNNVVTRTLTVLPPAADRVPPRVDVLTIANGQNPVTTTQVYLNATATDFPVENPSGVGHLRYIEFEYNQGNRLWIPVQDSAWVPYLQAQQNYPWQLSPVGGNHFIQAWARDNAGNISTFPYQAGIDYTPPVEQVNRNQTRFYRRTLDAGGALQVIVTPLSGDPDLYVWPPDWQNGRPPWVSNLSGSGVDAVTIVNAPLGGVYQIEVYGYTTSQYQIRINAGAVARTNGVTGGQDESKATPVAPLIDPASEPPRNLPQASPTPTPTPTATATGAPTATPTATVMPGHRVFLPVTER